MCEWGGGGGGGGKVSPSVLAAQLCLQANCLHSCLALLDLFSASFEAKNPDWGFPFITPSRKTNRASLVEAMEWFELFALTMATAVFTKIEWYIGSRTTQFTLPLESLAAIVTLSRSSPAFTNRLFSRRATADCTSVGAVATT